MTGHVMQSRDPIATTTFAIICQIRTPSDCSLVSDGREYQFGRGQELFTMISERKVKMDPIQADPKLPDGMISLNLFVLIINHRLHE